ncbi:carbamoyl-phosphate synthase large subunit [Alkalibacter mobilis]|uniref:carbamoyl-phosphate synthase large subunit n=1 Tax=Alkalibacter mobilis TaxID=2787712 RepID=UPI00189C8699|nr:carbamoyl-phosphate synthase large subunit [Alkalibacter mobilis]MBF7096757.1 carbamoyl-phosphate synthase large subunit [Alkalibacter mobilis]
MPKRTDINKVMIIGSGPIIIGQACEFDYSGTQACKALKSLGYKIVLVNSNPATIMTDPEIADVTYIEPLNVKSIESIIAKERPDALLPNLGGQTALNLSIELMNAGILDKYEVKVIGVQLDAIERGEDRIAFKESMDKLGIEMARSAPAYSVEEAERIAQDLGYPVVIRPAFTMGGTGGGLVYNVDELRTVASRGISASRVGQILIEESVLGWEELELEVVRDSNNKLITICFIENVDAIGVHTGDSFCTAPMLTISTELQQKLQDYAYRVVEAIEVIGGTNVQFAHDPKTGRVVIIEINPRTSRSSALASKATGFPIAYVSALLAAGITLDELPYWRDGSLDKYTPSGDYVVVKFARWAFEKFPGSQDKLGTQMKAVGEVMSIGKNYKEALQKAIRSLEIGRYGLGFAKDFNKKSLDELLAMLSEATSERHFILYEAIRKGADLDLLYKITHIKNYFLQQMKELVDLEATILDYDINSIPDKTFIEAKRDGFADRYLAQLLNTTETKVREKRKLLNIMEGWEAVPVSGVENAAYYFSTYNAPDQTSTTDKPKVMILGGGPNRIGQGIEFDYCCVHAAFSLRELGYETVIVNCNPETVSTDYDTSDKLYFEPLTVEDVLSIYEKENPLGVIVQFGGQTPLNIARELEDLGVNILGTSPATIDLAEDRDQFREIMEKLQIPMPQSGMAVDTNEALAISDELGFPLMVRPSYVLGGRGMEIVHDKEMLIRYMNSAVSVSPERPILIDRFLSNAIEAEADALSNGKDVFVPAIMEHIELAGIHSGDSACVIPPISIPEKHQETIKNYTQKIAKEMNVIGLMNMQYAISDDKVYVLEANPRASRTVPLVSKICNISMAKIATEILMSEFKGDIYPVDKFSDIAVSHYGVKEAVFPFNMFPEVDPVLGPEMRSTGEVLGISDSFGLSFYKAQEATQSPLPTEGTVLISVNDNDKHSSLELARNFIKIGFKIKATGGTHAYFKENGIDSEEINKLYEIKPNILDAIANGEIQLVINTPSSKRSQSDGSFIRKSSIRHKIPYITTITAALASAKGIEAHLENISSGPSLKSLQEYHANIK